MQNELYRSERERERNGQLCRTHEAFHGESMNISVLVAGRRGARGKRGHKEAVMLRNFSSVTEAKQSSHSKAYADRRKRKRSATEMEEPRPLRLRLEQVKETQNSAMKTSDRRSTRSKKKTEEEHPRYFVEIVSHQTVRFEKEAGWEERRRTREKEAVKATKQKLQKHILESGGLEKEEKRQQKRDEVGVN